MTAGEYILPGRVYRIPAKTREEEFFDLCFLTLAFNSKNEYRYSYNVRRLHGLEDGRWGRKTHPPTVSIKETRD